MKRIIVPLLLFIVSTIRPCRAQLPELGQFSGTYTHIATNQEGDAVLNIEHDLPIERTEITPHTSLPRPTGSISGRVNFMPLANGGYCISGNVSGTLTVYPSGGAFLAFFIHPAGDSGCFNDTVLVNATLSADGKSISGRYFTGGLTATGELMLKRPD